MSWRYIGTTRNSPPDFGEPIATVVRGYVWNGGKMVPAVLHGQEAFFMLEDGTVASVPESQFKFSPIFCNAALEAQLKKMKKLYNTRLPKEELEKLEALDNPS